MRAKLLTVPDIMLIAGTRMALGAGIAFLLANRLSEGSRRGAGWALLGVGVLSSVPLVMNALGGASRA